MSGSSRKRRSEGMTQSNTFSSLVQKYLLSLREVMTVKVPRNEKISGGEKNEWGKESILLSVEEEQIGGA